MSLGQIIRTRRQELNLTLDEVSSRIGFSKPYLSTIETGKVNNPPSDELLRKLEKALDVKPGLLLHIAHMEGMPADIRRRYEVSEAENKKLRNVMRNLKGRKPRGGGIGSLLRNADRGHLAMPAGELVPIINKVSAGYPADFNDLDYPVGVADDYVRCPDLHDPNAFAVRVVGDSMEPKFRQGDIVVFSPAAEVHSGDDCFVRFSGPHETTFKRVYFEPEDKVRLQPRNEKYPPTVVAGKRVAAMYRAIIRYEKL